MNAMRFDLNWVVPVYRTGRYVAELAERCRRTSERLRLRPQLVFVDDQCPEASHHEVEALGLGAGTRLLRLPRRLGQDGAIREGLRVTEGPVVLLDGDLQDPPEFVEFLWPGLQDGFDAVFADRHGPYEGATRRLSSVLYRRSMEWLAGLPRGAGLYVLMNASTASRVAATTATPISILAALAATRGRFASKPVRRAARRDGCSAYTGRDRLDKGLRSLAQAVRARHLGARL